MDPKLAQELLSLPQFQEFLAFLKIELNKLDTISTIPDSMTNEGFALEVTSRKHATQFLTTLLTPFITPQTPVTSSNNDFAM